MSVVQDAVQAVMKKAIALAPDGWIPGGHPDPLMHHKHGLIGTSISRIDGPLKVVGKAQFCAEFPMERLTYAALKDSTIARGRIVTAWRVLPRAASRSRRPRTRRDEALRGARAGTSSPRP
jgi:xanthine dehydrogenase YagR molybdenum-binding subunit